MAQPTADDTENMDRKPNPQVSTAGNVFGYPCDPESGATPNVPLATRANGKLGSHK